MVDEKEKMAGKYAYGGIKEHIYQIAAFIYVGGMFLLFYVYQTNRATNYTLIPSLTIISTIGCLLLFAQFLVSPYMTPKEPLERSE